VTGCRAHSLAQQPWLITVERNTVCDNPAFYLPLTMQAVSQGVRMRRIIIASSVVSLRHIPSAGIDRLLPSQPGWSQNRCQNPPTATCFLVQLSSRSIRESIILFPQSRPLYDAAFDRIWSPISLSTRFHMCTRRP
jgi:hypothetical protein